MKQCIKCKKKKELTGFYANKRSSDGKTSMCILCTKALNAKIYAKDKKAKASKDLYEFKAESKKKCSGCKKNKSTNQFSKNRSKDDGLASECKKCNGASNSKSYVKKIDQKKVQDKQIIKAAKVDIKRQAAIKIMSVPVNIKKTAVYYIMRNYTYTADSSMEPISLTKSRG